MKKNMTFSLSLLDVLGILFKKTYYVLGASLLAFLFSVFYITNFHSQEYLSRASFVVNKPINTTLINTASDLVHTDRTLEYAIDKLHEKQIFVLDGNPITVPFLRSGISVQSNVYSPTIIVTFVSYDKSLNNVVVNSIIEAAVLNGNSNYIVFTGDLMVENLSMESIKTGSTNVFISVVFTVLGGMIGITLILIDCIYGLKVQSIIPYRNLDKPIFCRLKYSCTNQILYSKEIYGFQNKLETLNPISTLKVLSVSDLDYDAESVQLIKELSKCYSKTNNKVLILDFEYIDSSSIKLNKDQKRVFIDVDFNYECEPMLVSDDPNVKLMKVHHSRSVARIIKSEKFGVMMEKYKAEYDYILLALKPLSIDESFLILNKYLDLSIVNVKIGKSSRKSLDSIISEFNLQSNQTLLINFVD